MLDEPVASLDPLAHREFLQLLMEAVAEDAFSVTLSSHLVADLELQSTLLVRHEGPVLDPAWSVSDVSLEDLVLAYIDRERRGTPAARKLGVAS